MYRLKLDDGWLFNADLPDYAIEKGTLTLEANKLGTLKFTVYDTNPAYQSIRKLTSLITVYRDSEIIWLGRPIKSKLNFKGGVEYTCEDILAKLNDIKRRPSYSKTTEGLYIQELMTDYNTRAGTAPEMVTDARKVRIVMGSTPHSGDDANLEFFNDDYIGYWDLMQTKVIETYGGYIKPTYSAGKVTIDYVGDEDLLESGQSIQFGENLDSLFVETDGNETFSVLIPLGADVSNPSAQGEMSKNTPLTIKGDSRSGGKDYIESAEGIEIYGRRETTMVWDDISTASALYDKGLEYLTENAIKLAEKITLTAIDLRYAGVNVEYQDFLKRVLVVSKKHSLTKEYPLRKMTISLNTPTASKIELGDEQNTLTDMMLANAANANGGYSKLSARVFSLENPN